MLCRLSQCWRVQLRARRHRRMPAPQWMSCTIMLTTPFAPLMISPPMDHKYSVLHICKPLHAPVPLAYQVSASGDQCGSSELCNALQVSSRPRHDDCRMVSTEMVDSKRRRAAPLESTKTLRIYQVEEPYPVAFLVVSTSRSSGRITPTVSVASIPYTLRRSSAAVPFSRLRLVLLNHPAVGGVRL